MHWKTIAVVCFVVIGLLITGLQYDYHLSNIAVVRP